MRLLEQILTFLRTRSTSKAAEGSRHNHANHQHSRNNQGEDQYAISLDEARTLAQNFLASEGAVMLPAHYEPTLGATEGVVGPAAAFGIDHKPPLEIGPPGLILVNRETGEVTWGPNPPFPHPSFPEWINEFLARPWED